MMPAETEIANFHDREERTISIRSNYEKPGPRNMPGEPDSIDPCLILYVDEDMYHRQHLNFAYKPDVVKTVVERETTIWREQGTPVEDITIDLETIDELLFDEDNATGHIGPW